MQQDQCDTCYEHGRADRITLPVLRTPFLWPNATGANISELRESINQRQGYRLFIFGSGDRRSDLTENASVASIGRSFDEQREEARPQPGGSRRDDKSNNAENERDDDMQASFLCSVGVETVCETCKEGEEPDRCRQKQGYRFGVAQRTDNGGEELVKANPDGDGGKHKGKDPNFDVFYCHDESLYCCSFFVIGRETCTCIKAKTVDRHLPLLRGQKLGVAGHVRKNKHSANSNHNRNDSLQNKQPFPRRQSCFTLHSFQVAAEINPLKALLMILPENSNAVLVAISSLR